MTNLFLATDPEKPEKVYRWSFVYLHGAAEDWARTTSIARNLEPTAFDIFVADSPVPEEKGLHLVNLYGHTGIANLQEFYNTTRGRVVLALDYDNHHYLTNPKTWR